VARTRGAGAYLVLIALTFIRRRSSAAADNLTLPAAVARSARESVGTAARACRRLPVDVRSSLIGAMAGYVSLGASYLFRPSPVRKHGVR